MVNQIPHLFEGTIRENLSLWNKAMDQSRIQRAAEDACIHDLIMSRQHEYDSVVEEGGRNFSGGERQRLEIARALVANPRLVVFDEATNALDPETEARVYQRVRHRKCTCLVVAHSLMTITHAENIVVLLNGSIAEYGSHASLIQTDGAYRALLNSDYARLAQEDSTACL
jgi:ABC-type multidrug transport system fused ATPase/permease subunit